MPIIIQLRMKVDSVSKPFVVKHPGGQEGASLLESEVSKTFHYSCNHPPKSLA